MLDIYFDDNYGKLYEDVEHGKACIFTCSTNDGIIKNQFIKREIPLKINGITYYDIVTPYGYGGPIIVECNGDRKKLVNNYFEQFSKYCSENNIVAEFVRFHPLFNNAIDFKDIYNAELNRHTLGTNLKDYDDPVQAEFSKSCRKTIRRVLEEKITFKMIESPNNLIEFKRIYYLNMERKNADEYYFFDDKYFENILNNYGNHILLAEAIFNDKVIAAGLYFCFNKIIHAHLSGTDTSYLNLSPAYVLKYGTALWGKENHYEYIHYGGGTSSSLEDPLYLFKSKFAKNTKFEFWIGKKVWDEDVYCQLCEQVNISKDEDYFPAYRKVLK